MEGTSETDGTLVHDPELHSDGDAAASMRERSLARKAQRRLDLQIEKMTQRLFTNAVK